MLLSNRDEGRKAASLHTTCHQHQGLFRVTFPDASLMRQHCSCSLCPFRNEKPASYCHEVEQTYL